MLYIFRFKINTLLCYAVVLLLVIRIARGQYYWILGALFGIVLTLVLMISAYSECFRDNCKQCLALGVNPIFGDIAGFRK